MSPLLLEDPGTRSARIAEHWVPEPSSYPLGHEILVERIILILEHPYELWAREILTENIFYKNPCRLSVSNCWTLVYWAVVLSTRPRSSCWENNFGTSWWIMMSRNLNRKYPKSKYLPGVEKELPFKNSKVFWRESWIRTPAPLYTHNIQ